DRFQEWVQAGVFQELWEYGLMAYDDWKGIDWSWLSMDGCMTKAPLGGEKDRQKSHRPSQEGYQAQPAGRGRRYPGGVGGGRCQPSRHENGRSDTRKYPRGASRGDSRRAAGAVPGLGL